MSYTKWTVPNVDPEEAKRRKADWLLREAAPDMAEALQLVMAWIDAWQPEFTQDPEWEEAERKAHAALVKAGRE